MRFRFAVSDHRKIREQNGLHVLCLIRQDLGSGKFFHFALFCLKSYDGYQVPLQQYLQPSYEDLRKRMDLERSFEFLFGNLTFLSLLVHGHFFLYKELLRMFYYIIRYKYVRRLFCHNQIRRRVQVFPLEQFQKKHHRLLLM